MYFGYNYLNYNGLYHSRKLLNEGECYKNVTNLQNLCYQNGKN